MIEVDKSLIAKEKYLLFQPYVISRLLTEPAAAVELVDHILVKS